METFSKLLGRDRPIEDISRQLYYFANDLRAPVVGAVHVTCSDEAERECIDAFQKSFVDYALPHLKFNERSHFRLANLGANYQWGAIRVAEQHYATPESENTFKVLFVKINCHVAVIRDADRLKFGLLQRYGRESACCGVLHSLVEGETLPYHIIEDEYLNK